MTPDETQTHTITMKQGHKVRVDWNEATYRLTVYSTFGSDEIRLLAAFPFGRPPLPNPTAGPEISARDVLTRIGRDVEAEAEAVIKEYNQKIEDAVACLRGKLPRHYPRDLCDKLVVQPSLLSIGHGKRDGLAEAARNTDFPNAARNTDFPNASNVPNAH